VQEWSVQRRTNLDGREVGDASSVHPFSLMLSTVFLVSCAAIVRSHQESINGTRLSTCAHRMNGVSGFRHTKVRRIHCVSCPVSKLLSNWYWISNALGLGYWNPRQQFEIQLLVYRKTIWHGRSLRVYSFGALSQGSGGRRGGMG